LVVAASIWYRRRSGGAIRIDFSMLEAMLWTMAEPLLAAQLGTPPQPRGNRSECHAPHGAYRCAGDDASGDASGDDWLSVAVTSDHEWRALCGAVPALAAMSELGLDARRERRRAIDAALADWASSRAAAETATALRRAGIPAAALASSVDLVADAHLRAREFWEAHGPADSGGVLPGLPWRASFRRASGPAPGLGADTDAVLRDSLDLTPDQIAALRQSGALG
jgi:crotonobetainyl-CoA:carnitine CoA-transferase CaiB-like acyl-CoA transferase